MHILNKQLPPISVTTEVLFPVGVKFATHKLIGVPDSRFACREETTLSLLPATCFALRSTIFVFLKLFEDLDLLEVPTLEDFVSETCSEPNSICSLPCIGIFLHSIVTTQVG